MKDEEYYTVVHCTEKRIKKELGMPGLNWDNMSIIWDYRTKKISPFPEYTKDEWVERFSIADSKTYKVIIWGSCHTNKGVWESIHFHFFDR